MDDDERGYFERAYQTAQVMGCRLAGYELRFILYYHLGRLRGRW